jgi:hypothetical protein
MKKILKKIMVKIETSVRVPHARFVEVVIGIGISMLAVPVLTTIDGSLLGQQAEAFISRR